MSTIFLLNMAERMNPEADNFKKVQEYFKSYGKEITVNISDLKHKIIRPVNLRGTFF